MLQGRKSISEVVQIQSDLFDSISMSNSLLRNYQVQWRENRLEYIKIYTVKELKA